MEQYQKNLIELLELLSSKKEQDDYQKNVPHVDIAAELICMWFDDFYIDDKLLGQFLNKEEIKCIKDFHKYYEERINKLPDSYADFWESSVWRNIVQKANETLKKIKKI